MATLKELQQLQQLCEGAGKASLYDLIGGERVVLDHRALRDELAKKEDAWSKSDRKRFEREIVAKALKLLKSPADKAQYDSLLATPEPQTRPRHPPDAGNQRPHPRQRQPQHFPNQDPWSHQQPPIPRPQPQQWRQPTPQAGLLGKLLYEVFLGPLKLLAWLLMFAVGLAVFSQMVGLFNSPPTEVAVTGEDPPEPPRPPLPPIPPPVDPPEPEGPLVPDPPPPVDPPEPEGPLAPDPPPPVDPPEPEGPLVPDPPPPVDPPAPGEPPAPELPPVEEPVRVGGSMTPRKTWNVPAEYPRLERLRRIEDDVILEVTVDRRGDVSNVSVLRSSVEALAEAAAEAVRQWRYEPTIVNGRPVSVILTETVRFQIRN